MDWRNKRVLTAPWTGKGELPGSAKFTNVADAKTMRWKDATFMRAWVEPGKKGLNFSQGTMLGWVHLERKIGQWRFESRRHAPPRRRSGVLCRDGVMACASVTKSGLVRVGGVEVIGNSGTVRILDPESKPVFRFELAKAGQWQRVDYPQDVEQKLSERPGSLFSMQGSGPRSIDVRPRLRYGELLATAGISIKGANCWSARAFVAAGTWPITGRLRWSEVVTTPRKITVLLFVGLRDKNSVDPVKTTGKHALLKPSAVFVSQAPQRKHTLSQGLGERFEIPAARELDGVVVLFQWIALIGEDSAAFSEVFGTAILRDRSARSARIWNRLSSAERKASLARAWAWLGAGEQGELTKHKQLAARAAQLFEKLAK